MEKQVELVKKEGIIDRLPIPIPIDIHPDDHFEYSIEGSLRLLGLVYGVHVKGKAIMTTFTNLLSMGSI